MGSAGRGAASHGRDACMPRLQTPRVLLLLPGWTFIGIEVFGVQGFLVCRWGAARHCTGGST